ncbi:reverse transcriptase [Plakobranchus ocellatus]|uniref:Reverse transcriptase n=1 Tax=Plakobranchus ocellatus TaxID=259542 RepID=A0AAV4B6R8_9GAST|nr:reverse transcriptase [Plakobranchus ocellatus]
MQARLDALTWRRMSFKPKKSQSLPIRKGKLDEDFYFKIARYDILESRTTQELDKNFIKLYYSSLKDTKRGSKALEQASVGLLAIDDIRDQRFNCYNISISQAKINRFTRKPLGVPPGLTDVAVYCRTAKLRVRLSLKSIVQEYKCRKTRLISMLEDSVEPAVRSIQPQLRTGRKWNIDEQLTKQKRA